MKKESKYRSVIKTLSWRLIGTLINVIVIYCLFKDFVLSIMVGIVDAVIKTIIYFLHERLWSNIKWGYDGED